MVFPDGLHLGCERKGVEDSRGFAELMEVPLTTMAKGGRVTSFGSGDNRFYRMGVRYAC